MCLSTYPLSGPSLFPFPPLPFLRYSSVFGEVGGGWVRPRSQVFPSGLHSSGCRILTTTIRDLYLPEYKEEVSTSFIPGLSPSLNGFQRVLHVVPVLV